MIFLTVFGAADLYSEIENDRCSLSITLSNMWQLEAIYQFQRSRWRNHITILTKLIANYFKYLKNSPF